MMRLEKVQQQQQNSFNTFLEETRMTATRHDDRFSRESDVFSYFDVEDMIPFDTFILHFL